MHVSVFEVGFGAMCASLDTLGATLVTGKGLEIAMTSGELLALMEQGFLAFVFEVAVLFN